MEPLRGGKLASLEDENAAVPKGLRPEEGFPLAFRFLPVNPRGDHGASGMSNFRQMQENIAVFEEDKPLDEKEMARCWKWRTVW